MVIVLGIILTPRYTQTSEKNLEVTYLAFDISLFSQELEEFWVYRALFVELTKKLTYCAKAELIPLMEVTGVLEVSLFLVPQLRLFLLIEN